MNKSKSKRSRLAASALDPHSYEQMGYVGSDSQEYGYEMAEFDPSLEQEIENEEVVEEAELDAEDAGSAIETDGGLASAEGLTPLREQDRFLPIANIARIMKRAVPQQGKVSKEAKECMQECVSEFIGFITSEACERCLNERRKTINGEDLLVALQTLGFDQYIEPLKAFLIAFRESSKTGVTLHVTKEEADSTVALDEPGAEGEAAASVVGGSLLGVGASAGAGATRGHIAPSHANLTTAASIPAQSTSR